MGCGVEWVRAWQLEEEKMWSEFSTWVGVLRGRNSVIRAGTELVPHEDE